MNSLKHGQVKRIRLATPGCTLGITDGSERGGYAGAAHIIDRIGRPHHVTNLMFQYYPDIEGWPTQGVKWHGFFRNNSLNEGDGYFPMVLEEGGEWGRLFLKQIADVRSHGQEPQLTLTLHCDTPDEMLIRIAESLVPYGRMRIRINHECNGNWFYFNRRWSFKEVSDFFIRFHNILHEYAPEVSTVGCWNGPGEAYSAPEKAGTLGKLTTEELGEMFKVCDIVSYDQYASLHYMWPDPNFDFNRPDGSFSIPFEFWWKTLNDCHDQMCELRGKEVDIEVHEINEDVDLYGVYGQAEWVSRFYREVLVRKYDWLTNITFYMFRDRGGLGLEWENPEDPTRVEDREALSAYCEATKDPHFDLKVVAGGVMPQDAPLEMKWISSTESEGIAVTYESQRSGPATIELPSRQHILIGCNGTWTVKGSGTASVNLPFKEGANEVHLFMPPADGKNNVSGAYVDTLAALPIVRP